ncbi:TROVE domain-containing protein [Paenibacillus apiarius]|uniref:TROVE domain-containing protein n=1 Tax=Paenibacillus apiarius TaxID=46240 RepID=A0ABT4DXT3_9BACL|nr:TROVE domain-containing protein [Paenibacillus apiarius]MCY9517567.1 TROVE domain-containing protein [Paenibacillus apiarius]MCY9522154.1 TROVE domain-containing protein [Paenibacillus apiarius]MCY9552188.1 TROVE domain-containing protein [Paenibacillus apiarius]MCY9560067.1 TROVE domain-containing protein [Paenibacillus apiarius]MCY9683685.1 TROVE domain-containing protein [Paenibacillus apiarius]
MSFARKLFSAAKPTTRNCDGYPAYARSAEEQYLQTLLTNTMGNTFYADRNELQEDASLMHMEMAERNPQFMAKALVYARNEGYMRLQPLYGLAVLSCYRSDLFAKVFLKVVLIPSDLSDFLTILQGLGRGEGGRAVKRQVNRFLAGVSEYWALKYNGRGRGYSLGDAIATAHPKPADLKQQALFRHLRGREANLALLPQVEALENLKRANTEKKQLRWITQGKLPYSTVTGAIKPTKAIWEALLRQMPAFALLRHLNALLRAGVFENEANLQYAVQRLADREALAKAKILPFRFALAYEQVNHPVLRDALREAVELTFGNLPELGEQTAIFLDISGSMSGEYLRIGSVFALALYKKTQGNSLFWLFDTKVLDAKPSRHDSILSQAERIRVRGGTDTGAPVRELLRQGKKVDQIIIITDEQQNSGSPFYEALSAYRAQVNPEVKAFIVDIAPYRTAMVPPQDTNTHYIYGWSDNVLTYIAQTVQGYKTLVERVESITVEEARDESADGRE